MCKSLPPISDRKTGKVLLKFLRHVGYIVKYHAKTDEDKKLLNAAMFDLLTILDNCYIDGFPVMTLTMGADNTAISSYLHEYFVAFSKEGLI